MFNPSLSLSVFFVSLIIVLTNFTNKSHICRASLKAVCFQSREVSSFAHTVTDPPFIVAVDIQNVYIINA